MFKDSILAHSLLFMYLVAKFYSFFYFYVYYFLHVCICIFYLKSQLQVLVAIKKNDIKSWKMQSFIQKMIVCNSFFLLA